MSFGTIIKNDLAKLAYQAVAIANMADNAASSPLTNVFSALHTADPLTGDQTTSEATYTGYARVATARTAGGWAVSGGVITPVASIVFPACTAGSNLITHWSTGFVTSGASKIINKAVIGSVQGPFTAATNDNLIVPGNTFAVDDRCAFYPTHGSSLPTGITEGTVYFIKTVATETITISATQGGATLDVTAIGDGVCFKVTPITVTAGTTPGLSTTSALTYI